jgi:hypothetical protein
MMIVLEERGYICRHEGDSYSLTNRLSILAERQSNNRSNEAPIPALK